MAKFKFNDYNESYYDDFEKEQTKHKSKKQKRKWREIEVIKEKLCLQKELEKYELERFGL